MKALTMAQIKQLAQAMREIIESEDDPTVQEIALGVVVVLMGPLPEPRDRLCRMRPDRLAALPAQWEAEPDES